MLAPEFVAGTALTLLGGAAGLVWKAARWMARIETAIHDLPCNRDGCIFRIEEKPK